MANDFSSPLDECRTTPRVDATSEFRKRRRRDWGKESQGSTHFLSALLEWDTDPVLVVTAPRERHRSVKKHHFEILDDDGNPVILQPRATLDIFCGRRLSHHSRAL
jgi:hypothetical protein